MKLLKNGDLNPSISILIGILGVAVLFIPLLLDWHPYLRLGGFILCIVLCGFSATALQASTLKIRSFKKYDDSK